VGGDGGGGLSSPRKPAHVLPPARSAPPHRNPRLRRAPRGAPPPRPHRLGRRQPPGPHRRLLPRRPCFDADGSLLVVDIPHGRILRVRDGAWSEVAHWDGEPNGLKRAPDGRLLIADYRRGLLELQGAPPRPILARRNSESFKGLNDLAIAADGTIYVTDQGQTGLHDPTGRVYRLSPTGKLDTLLTNAPSPNGLALTPDETVLFVAMTRDNAVWRLPLLADGSTAKVGRFATFWGTSGPDGLATDWAGNLYVCHASLGCVFVLSPQGHCTAIIESCAGPTTTNLAFTPDGKSLVITESATGTILIADL
jgi:gluconolactonase